MTAPDGGVLAVKSPVQETRPADGFETLFRNAPCGYVTTTEAGSITRVNDTFLAWSGFRREELLGTSFARLLPVGDRILWSTHSVPQLRSSGGVSEVVVEVVGSDRVRRPALLTAVQAPVETGPGATDVLRGELEVRIIVFGAPERRAAERELIQALHRAEEAEDRRVAAEVENRQQALRDPLTGLPNREGVAAHLHGLRGVDEPHVAVVVVDLDHFAVVNESLGIRAGDELLTTVAQRLRGAVRDGAFVARSSADEFVVVERCEDDEALRALAERLLVEVIAPVVLDGLEVVATASIGAASAGPAPGSAYRALHNAGVAAQRAKARGRARVELHDPAAGAASAQNLRRLGELRTGIAQGELRLQFQPQVRLGRECAVGDGVAAGCLSGAEALVRWEHPTLGMLPPSEFIDLAEASGLVVQLGTRVLDMAVAQAARWAADPECVTLEVAVNLSSRQLTDPGLLTAVTETLARYDLPAHLLVLEVTETSLVADPDTAVATLAALKELGVGVSVDDFGTGYASLTYLQRFPVDELKIDRSFVMGLGASAGDTAIVRACVQLAHAVGVRAVAEGVETEEQRRLLSELGCDIGQGYLFARPLGAQALQDWARGHREASDRH